jgi:LmbE family N-acetylglucosaminyl deacetylase/GT2 family glycosyltransferase
LKGLYPPFGDPSALPQRVLVVAPHPDDEVFGCGGMLAWHQRVGAEVRVVVLTDGVEGDPDARAQDIAGTRVAESRAAGGELGVDDYRFLGYADGALGEASDLPDRLAAELEEFGPGLVYGPSPAELHPDHRAASRALVAALARGAVAGGSPRRVFLYGVNTQVQAGVLFDTTPVYERKQAAIRRFASQLEYMDLLAKCEACDRARTVNVEDPAVEFIEGFIDLDAADVARYERAMTDVLVQVQDAEPGPAAARGLPAATAVISTWNKADVVRENLESLRAQTLPFEAVVVVDNASTDGTAEMIARDFPEVTLVVMPSSDYGACETFNIGFASATTPLIAILDDDVTLPPDWLEKATARLTGEPATTAIVSTEVIEPGMPPEYVAASKAAGRRYMSTFRGCGSLARRAALEEAGYYDERLFIYGNERDLTCRLLNLGFRVLQDPEIETFHKTPFGIQLGKRSLYYHARNAWLSMLKYAPLPDLLRMPFLVVTRVLLRRGSAEAAGGVTDATGTIGIGRAVRETPGATWVLLKAAFSVLYNVPYCLRHRRPVSAEDFELPLG